MKPSRPVLRYFGGKFRIRSWITSFFPPHRIYVEPFGGAGSVLLAKEPSHAEVYNDMDGEVVNLFRVLRDPKKAARLKAALDLTPFSRDEFDLAYEPTKDAIEQARRLVVRCFLGFGATAHDSSKRTGFRSKSWRQRQTGVDDWRTYPESIPAFTARLRHAMIEHMPALDLITRHDGVDTLFYVDPPYVHRTRRSVRDKSRYRHEMSDDDHRKLAAVLRGCLGMVVLSGYSSDLYADLFPGWERHDTHAVSGGTDQAARKRVESVWLNPASVAALKASRSQLEIVA